jgi:hypothetical protein
LLELDLAVEVEIRKTFAIHPVAMAYESSVFSPDASRIGTISAISTGRRDTCGVLQHSSWCRAGR